MPGTSYLNSLCLGFLTYKMGLLWEAARIRHREPLGQYLANCCSRGYSSVMSFGQWPSLVHIFIISPSLSGPIVCSGQTLFLKCFPSFFEHFLTLCSNKMCQANLVLSLPQPWPWTHLHALSCPQNWGPTQSLGNIQLWQKQSVWNENLVENEFCSVLF